MLKNFGNKKIQNITMIEILQCINESLCNNPVPPKFTRVYLQPGPHQRAAAPNDTDSVVRGETPVKGLDAKGVCLKL